MVNPINNVGKTGDLGNEYDIQWTRFQARGRLTGAKDFKSNLFLNGIDGDVVLQQIENHIEGSDANGNGKDGDLLSWDKYLESNDKKNDLLFQSSDNKTYTNVNFNAGTYDIMDEKGFTEKLGMSWENGKPYDAFEINQNKINFYDFVFGGVGDGNQMNTEINLTQFDNARWGLQNYTIREVDTSYWNKATDYTNNENLLSKDSLRVIMQSIPQWMTEQIKNQLSAYKEGSPEYIAKFYAAAIKIMDQEGIYNGTYK